MNLIFLPGAAGFTEFWQPLQVQLSIYPNQHVIDYAGFGHTPADPNIRNFAELTQSVLHRINQPSVLIAQSMGGVFAVATALEKPELVKGLVLIATSGGIDLNPFHVADWRTQYHQDFQHYPDWFSTVQVNYETELHKIQIPVLLIWGDADPISPVAVGEYLKNKLPNSQLEIIAGGKHDLANQHTNIVSQHIERFMINTL